MKRDALLSSDRQGDLGDDDVQLHSNGNHGKKVQATDDDEDMAPVSVQVIARVREFLQQPVRIIFVPSVILC
jgi:hypothetical protein